MGPYPGVRSNMHAAGLRVVGGGAGCALLLFARFSLSILPPRGPSILTHPLPSWTNLVVVHPESLGCVASLLHLAQELLHVALELVLWRSEQCGRVLSRQ